MKKILGMFLLVAGILGLVSFSASAQNSPDEKIKAAAGDRYLISAKAGGINFIEGKVYVDRKNGKSGLLLKGDSLETGDVVTTDSTGKVEILLNPGSYLRLGGNSEFKFIDTNLDTLKLGLMKGSGIFEVYASDDYKVTVQTPKNNYYFVDSGVFRIDIFSDKETIAVTKGLAQVGDSAINIVKGGRRAVLTSNDFQVAKFDKDEGDTLDQWSKMRSKELAQLNKKLQKDSMRSALIDSYRRQNWGFFDSFGLWVFDPISRMYCFMPFSRGWLSPYGYGFGYNVWNYYPWVYPTHPNPTPPSNPTPPTTPPSNTPTEAQIREDRRLNMQTPPFIRMNQSNYRNESVGGASSGGSYNSDGSYDASRSSSGNSSRSSSSSGNSSRNSSSSSSSNNTSKGSSPPPPSSNTDSKGKP